jgi:hypothetical protein
MTATGRRPAARKGKTMRFSLSHRRALIGHDVTVKVTAAAKEAIARVTAELDGRALARDALAPPEVQYERVFHQVGGGGPGQQHVLSVKATNSEGEAAIASLRWNDVS